MSVHPSVCPSHAGILWKLPKHIKVFHRQVAHHFSLFRTKHYGNIPTGTPNGGVECKGYEKITIFDQYLAFCHSKMMQVRTVILTMEREYESKLSNGAISNNLE